MPRYLRARSASGTALLSASSTITASDDCICFDDRDVEGSDEVLEKFFKKTQRIPMTSLGKQMMKEIDLRCFFFPSFF